MFSKIIDAGLVTMAAVCAWGALLYSPDAVILTIMAVAFVAAPRMRK